jgi:NitT/TauT family transport system ATP-binding protein
VTPETIVAFQAVSKDFDDHARGTAAVGEVTLDVLAGEFVAITGPSGSGKSTLLRLAADLIAPTSGTVRVCGAAPAEARRGRQLGMVFQAPVLMDWRNVLGNVELPLALAGVGRAERRRRARAVLALVGLADAERLHPRQLSGGMQQRVAIARAIVTQPRVLLMDEPFAALDELTRERLNAELLRIWAETGVTVLFVTHHIEEAVFLADRVVVLTPRPGRLAANIRVRLPRPRDEATRHDPAFYELANLVRTALHAAAGSDRRPGDRTSEPIPFEG